MNHNDHQLADQILTFEEDLDFFQKNIDEMRKNHLNRFIAINHQTIVGEASSIDELKRILDRKNLDIGLLVVKFISEEGETIIL